MFERTSYHDNVVEHHQENGLMPHASTHTKRDIMEWATTTISTTFHVVDKASLVGSVVAILVHHHLPEKEAKQIAFEISHKLTSISVFSNFIGNFWDEYVRHQKNEVSSTVNSARSAANVLRQKG